MTEALPTLSHALVYYIHSIYTEADYDQIVYSLQVMRPNSQAHVAGIDKLALIRWPVLMLR